MFISVFICEVGERQMMIAEMLLVQTQGMITGRICRLWTFCFISCFLAYHTGSGSDAASLLTSAQRKGDTYVLNGSKVPLCSC